jgi:hypothetical protein
MDLCQDLLYSVTLSGFPKIRRSGDRRVEVRSLGFQGWRWRRRGRRFGFLDDSRMSPLVPDGLAGALP